VPPARGVLVLAVLTIARSADGVTVMLLVPVLFPGTVSVVPGGTVTVAVLTKLPVALPATLTWKVIVATPPLAKVAVPLMVVLPAPETLALTAPVLVLVTAVMVPSPAGKVSAQLAAVAVLGPLLVITMV
jgi:hypothetical protein